jgi:hypothetical protein
MRKLLGVVAMVCGFLSLGVFLPTIASAALIYSNGVPGSSVGGTEISTYFLAEDFTLTQAATLNSVRFWDLDNGSGYLGSITWAIYSNNGSTNEPGVPLAGPTNTTAVTRTLTRPGEYQNDFNTLPVPLSGNTTYWLALHNGALGPNGDHQFYWEWDHTASGGDNPGRVCSPSTTVTCLSTTDWSPYSTTEYDFQLFGDALVPEPSTLLLIGSALPGLAGVLIHRRRKSRSRL